MGVFIADDHIRFTDYPFPGATVHPAGTLGPEAIRDADSTAMPPQIRTVLGETLFVPRAQDAEPEVRAELGDLPAFYDWAMRIAERHR